MSVPAFLNKDLDALKGSEQGFRSSKQRSSSSPVKQRAGSPSANPANSTNKRGRDEPPILRKFNDYINKSSLSNSQKLVKSKKLDDHFQLLLQLTSDKPEIVKNLFTQLNQDNAADDKTISKILKETILTVLTQGKGLSLTNDEIKEIGKNNKGNKTGKQNLSGYIEALVKKDQTISDAYSKIKNTPNSGKSLSENIENMGKDNNKYPDSVTDFPAETETSQTPYEQEKKLQQNTEIEKKKQKLMEQMQKFHELQAKGRENEEKAIIQEHERQVNAGIAMMELGTKHIKKLAEQTKPDTSASDRARRELAKADKQIAAAEQQQQAAKQAAARQQQ